MLRLDYVAIDKKGFGKIIDMLGHIAAGVEEKLLHLVYLRVSQINGCSYCVDMHFSDALKAGVEARHINGVVTWPHMPFFTDAYKAAFAWAEALTRLEKQEVPEEIFTTLAQHFSPEQIVALTHAITQMNALNRLAISFGRHPDA